MNAATPVNQRKVIEEIWKEILRLPEIDSDRTFMDLGGTSLSANQLVVKIGKSLGLSVPVIKVFEYPTLRQFTKFLIGGDSVESRKTETSNSISETAPVQNTSNSNNSDDQDIAVIGMACRFPGAKNVDEFWKNLVEGKDSITMLSKEELSPEISDELKNDPRYVRARGLIDRPFALDAAFFDISPMEAKLIDPQQRVLLETAWEALENAGHGPGSFEGKTAIFAGIEDNTYYKEEISPFPEAEKRAGRFSIMTGNEKDFVAMRIAHKLNLKGPAVSVHTACSTSLVAVIMAAKSLRYGECDMALAGGSSVHFPTHDGYYFQEGGVFSSDGHCRPFDKDAEGTIFTDGSGIVVLRRLKDAIRDRNTIYAVIKGGAVNSDGGDKISFSAPSIAGQATCISDALADAKVDAGSIQFVEAHGTATPMGDPIEMEGLRQAFRKHTQKQQFCALGSVKSNIGHTTTAAGVASLIKTVLALKNKAIPATLHYKSPNPGLDIENSPFYVANRLTEWKREQGPRRAGVSSFGIGGTNSHAILEEAPELTADVLESVERPFEILPVSAKTKSQRDALLAGLTKLKSDTRDIAFSLQNGRTRFKVRGARIKLSSADSQELVVQADQVIEQPRLVFMFPGQGSQYIQMGKSLFDSFPEFRKTFLECCTVLDRELGFDFKSFIFDASNKETLENTKFTQPALFAIEVSLGKMLLEWGIIPDAMVGHSIGEFAAAYLAGVFTLEEGLRLIAARGRLMSSLPRGKMLSARGPLETVLKLTSGLVDVASINSPIHSVLAGENEKIAEIQALLEKNEIPCKLLHTSHAFHSAMMTPVVEPFLEIAKTVKFKAPRFTIISTVTGERMLDEQATDPMYWANHLRATVRFSQAILKAIEEGGNIFLEVGPRTTLASLALQHLKGAKATAIGMLGETADPASEIGAVGSALAKLWSNGWELMWNRIWTGGYRIPVMTYPFEKKDYRFSENRKAERPQAQFSQVAVVEQEALVPVASVQVEAEVGVEVLLKTDLGQLLREYSGLEVDAPDATFFETGFDSLVLMQIGVQLGKKYSVSVSLHDLMGKHNTLNLLTSHILKVAMPDKMPRVVRAQQPVAAVVQQPTRALVAQPQAVVQALPTQALEPMPTDVAKAVYQQLNQMKALLEKQLGLSDGNNALPVQAAAPAPLKGTALLRRLIRARHSQPPVAGAFRGKTPSGDEAWYRYDAKTQRYEMLKYV